MVELPPYGYAILSAVAWAVSAQFLNAGLDRIPVRDKLPSILLGLLVSLVTGTAIMSVVLGPAALADQWLWELVLAGLFTFPLGTGLYYVCGHAFGGRMEFASQFANVKPIFSILIAITLLGEPLLAGSSVPLVLLLGGIAALLIGSARGEFSYHALGLGLLLAISWAVGEAFIKIGVGRVSSLPATFVALSSGTLIGLLFATPYLLKRRRDVVSPRLWLWAFAVHGALSFVVAYSALFESIRRIGLANSILINAFWPALAVAVAWLLRRRRLAGRSLSPAVIVATVLLLAGSISHVLVLSR